MSSYMMTSSMETFSALLAICAGNSPVPGEFPTQKPVTQNFDVSFDLRRNKRLNKQQSWGWWFETLLRPLWRQCDEQNLVKIISALLLILMIQSCHNFANAMAAQMSRMCKITTLLKHNFPVGAIRILDSQDLDYELIDSLWNGS